MTSQKSDYPVEPVEVQVFPVDGGSGVDWGPPLVHVFVEFRHQEVLRLGSVLFKEIVVELRLFTRLSGRRRLTLKQGSNDTQLHKSNGQILQLSMRNFNILILWLKSEQN